MLGGYDKDAKPDNTAQKVELRYRIRAETKERERDEKKKKRRRRLTGVLPCPAVVAAGDEVA